MISTKPPIKRLQYIHQELKDGKMPNTVKLARDLEVSRRTILRDIEYLRDQLSAPIIYDPDTRGYKYTQPNYVFPSITISEGELVAMFIAEKVLALYSGTPYEKELKSAFQKIISNLPEEISISFAAIDQTHSFRLGASTEQDINNFKKISNATLHKKQLKIEYMAQYSGEKSTRVIDPYHLFNLNGDWYVIGHCHLRDEIRIFMCSRISNITETGKTFTLDGNFNASDYLEKSFGVYAGKERHVCKIKFDQFASRYIQEKTWHKSQSIENFDDKTLVLTLDVNNLIEIKRWVLSWGEHAKVLEPGELKEDIKRTIYLLSKTYKEKPRTNIDESSVKTLKRKQKNRDI